MAEDIVKGCRAQPVGQRVRRALSQSGGLKKAGHNRAAIVTFRPPLRTEMRYSRRSSIAYKELPPQSQQDTIVYTLPAFAPLC